MRWFLVLLGLLVAGLVGWWSLYTVDRGEFVYVTQFGRPVRIQDGLSEGGLYAKLPWPVQSVQRLDRRLQYFDLPESELLTNDPEGKTIDKTVTVVAYVCWRIADKDSVDLFIRRIGTPERARTILGERIRGQLGALIGQMRMDDLVSVDPQRVDTSLADLRRRLLTEPGTEQARETAPLSLEQRARGEYGIELVDIRLRRTSHPLAVQDAIFNRIRSERQKKVADYQSEGDRQAQDIKSEAERKYRETLAGARAEEQRLKGEAEVEADRIRNQAHSKDVEFYTFLKKLEEYQKILGDNKTMLLLSSHGDLFDVLFKPPKPAGPSPAAPAVRDAAAAATPKAGKTEGP
jgi:membrane protease subunit HflC